MLQHYIDAFLGNFSESTQQLIEICGRKEGWIVDEMDEAAPILEEIDGILKNRRDQLNLLGHIPELVNLEAGGYIHMAKGLFLISAIENNKPGYVKSLIEGYQSQETLTDSEKTALFIAQSRLVLLSKVSLLEHVFGDENLKRTALTIQNEVNHHGE